MVSLYQKVWGERSLTLGELIGFLTFGIIVWLNAFGKWTIWIGLIVLFLAVMLF